jgi:hypothetical protein
MATVRLRDGEVTLYTRGVSKNYYAGYSLRGGGRLQESLKTRNKAVAKERALEHVQLDKQENAFDHERRIVAQRFLRARAARKQVSRFYR